MVTPSGILVWSFAALALLVGAAFPIGLFAAMRRLGSGTAAWMAITLAAAASGRLAFGPMPPPVGILFVLILAGAGALGLSRVGERLALGLPLALLVGAQGFRLPREILRHRAHVEGVMPVQMSYAGLIMNEPANVWITHPPFVWLPSVLVFTAILGHIVVFRRLRAEARQGPRSAGRVVAEREAATAGATRA
jgi:hypothetical protein